MAPTSSPRVGCAAIRTLGSRDTSLATTSFCWLPPDSSDAFDDGVPPRTSNSEMSSRALATIRLGRSQPRCEFGSCR